MSSALNDGRGSFKAWEDIATARQAPEESRTIHRYYSSVFAVLFLDIPWACVRLPGPAGEGCIPETRCGAGTHPFYGQDRRDSESFQRWCQHISMWESPCVGPVLSVRLSTILPFSLHGREKRLSFVLVWVTAYSSDIWLLFPDLQGLSLPDDSKTVMTSVGICCLGYLEFRLLQGWLSPGISESHSVKVAAPIVEGTLASGGRAVPEHLPGFALQDGLSPVLPLQLFQRRRGDWFAWFSQSACSYWMLRCGLGILAGNSYCR